MTSAINIERGLRARYRQPAGVEQFGIEPVPEELKTAGWFDLFSIMFNFLINPGMMLSGGLMVAAGLSFQAALAAGFFGTIRGPGGTISFRVPPQLRAPHLRGLQKLM